LLRGQSLEQLHATSSGTFGQIISISYPPLVQRLRAANIGWPMWSNTHKEASTRITAKKFGSMFLWVLSGVKATVLT
jgi:hypothetical protein